MNYEVLSLRTAKKLKQQELEIDRLNDILDEIEKEIKWLRKQSLVLDMYGVSICDKLLDKVDKLRSKDDE
jgi:hypothetical protein